MLYEVKTDGMILKESSDKDADEIAIPKFHRMETNGTYTDDDGQEWTLVVYNGKIYSTKEMSKAKKKKW